MKQIQTIHDPRGMCLNEYVHPWVWHPSPNLDNMLLFGTQLAILFEKKTLFSFTGHIRPTGKKKT